MSALVPITIDGWPLVREGEHVLIRDLELADRAEMANPRDIRAHIKKAAEDGMFIIVAAGDDDPPGAFARAVVEMVPVAKGARRKTTVYYLNREAALHVLMRLRTPKAVELQVAVVRVFLLAMDRQLQPAAGVTQLAATVTDLAMQVRAMGEQLATISRETGTISGLQADWIAGEVTVLADLRVKLGYSTSTRAARAWINNRITAAAQWGGTGAARRLMPAERYGAVKVCLAQLRSDLEAEARRRAVKILPSRAQGQEQLFEKPRA